MAAGVAAVAVAFQLTNLTTVSVDWDGAQFNMGANYFSPAIHQPHPPGYPTWIFLLKGWAALGVAPALAQGMMAFAATLAGLGMFYRLCREWFGDSERAVFTTSALAVSPLVLLNAGDQSTYAAATALACAVALWCWQGWNGRAARVFAAALALGVLSGLRPQLMVFLGPLVLVSAWRAHGGRVGQTVAAGAVAGVGAMTWFLPMVVATGGWQSYWGATSAQTSNQVLHSSFWLGGPWLLYRNMLIQQAVWVGSAVAPALALWALSKGRRGLERRRWEFLVLWAAPQVLFCVLIHGFRPSHYSEVLPAAFLAAASLAGEVRLRAAAAALAAGVVVGYLPWTALLGTRWDAEAITLLKVQPRLISWEREKAMEFRRLVERYRPEWFIVTRYQPYAPNYRTIGNDFRPIPAVDTIAKAPPSGLVMWVAEDGAKEGAKGKLVYTGYKMQVYLWDRGRGGSGSGL